MGKVKHIARVSWRMFLSCTGCDEEMVICLVAGDRLCGRCAKKKGEGK